MKEIYPNLPDATVSKITFFDYESGQTVFEIPFADESETNCIDSNKSSLY